MSVYTVALIKPDAFKRQLVGDVVTEILRADLRIRRAGIMERGFLRHQAREFYIEHQGRTYFEDLCTFMGSGPVFAFVLEGEAWVDAVAVWRSLMGPADPHSRPPNTIRGKYAARCPTMENLVHGSDSPEAAGREHLLLRTWQVLP